MFGKFAKLFILVGALGFGSALASAIPANAQGLSVTLGTPEFSVTFGDSQAQNVAHRGFRDRRHRRGHGWRGRHWDGGHGYGRRDECRPRRALRKAERHGLRRAHVVRMGHRNVVVAGRKRGERVVVGFANVRGCPVRFVRHR